MTEDEKQIVNTVLLPGCRVETIMKEKEFWEACDAERDIKNGKVTVEDVMGARITFYAKDVVGFIDRTNWEISEEMRQMAEAAASGRRMAPTQSKSGIVIPGQRPY